MNREVVVETGETRSRGHLAVPESARGLVLFAHAGGRGHHSPTNRFVASILNDAGLATSVADLLSPDEEQDRMNIFDIELLRRRLIDVTGWARAVSEVKGLPVSYLGAGTGAAAALAAAARPGAEIVAVVSRDGRPDLAGSFLPAVRAPTLLIVGAQDEVGIDLTRRAQSRLRCRNRLTVVPGATHLFEEPGALHVAADAARDWFLEHLPGHCTLAI